MPSQPFTQPSSLSPSSPPLFSDLLVCVQRGVCGWLECPQHPLHRALPDKSARIRIRPALSPWPHRSRHRHHHLRRGEGGDMTASVGGNMWRWEWEWGCRCVGMGVLIVLLFRWSPIRLWCCLCTLNRWQKAALESVLHEWTSRMFCQTSFLFDPSFQFHKTHPSSIRLAEFLSCQNNFSNSCAFPSYSPFPFALSRHPSRPRFQFNGSQPAVPMIMVGAALLIGGCTTLLLPNTTQRNID